MQSFRGNASQSADRVSFREPLAGTRNVKLRQLNFAFCRVANAGTGREIFSLPKFHFGVSCCRICDLSEDARLFVVVRRLIEFEYDPGLKTS